MDQAALRQLTSKDDIKKELVKQFTKHIEEEELDGPDDSVIKVKMVVVGPMSAGKTSLLTQLIHKKFNQAEQATVGAKYCSQGVAIEDIVYNFEIWDLSGDDWYKSLVPMYLQYAQCVVICYDTTNVNSFEEAKGWLRYVKDIGENDLLIAFVGMKSDLAGAVGEGVVKQIANESQQFFIDELHLDRDLLFPTTSAKSFDQVQDVILTLAEKMNEKGVKNRASVMEGDNSAPYDFAKKVETAKSTGKKKEPAWYTSYLGISEEKMANFSDKMGACWTSTKNSFSVCFENSKEISIKTIDSTKKNVKSLSRTMDRKSRKFGNDVKQRTAQLIQKYNSNTKGNKVALGPDGDIRDTWDDDDNNDSTANLGANKSNKPQAKLVPSNVKVEKLKG